MIQYERVDDSEDAVVVRERREPIYRIGNQVHELDKRVHVLEHEIKNVVVSQNTLTAVVHKIEITLSGLTADMKEHVKTMEEHIKSALLEHESREFMNHKAVLKEIVRTMLYFLIALLFIGGALFWSTIKWKWLLQ